MKYFTIKELTKSATAQRKGIKNDPSIQEVANLTALIEKVLDPLREAYGKPIIVTSGYRCEKLNKAVGGAASSQHVKGQAADIRSVQDTPEENKKLFDLIVQLKLPFDQLINEYGYDWVHVSYGPRHRRQKLKAVKKNGKTSYIIVTMIALAMLLLTGCSPRVIEHEIIRTDTLYQVKVQKDSIFHRDSVYIHEWQAGDTIYKEKVKWVERWKERERIDTLYISKTDTLKVKDVVVNEVAKPLGWWQKLFIWIGAIFSVFLIGFLILNVIRKE